MCDGMSILKILILKESYISYGSSDDLSIMLYLNQYNLKTSSFKI